MCGLNKSDIALIRLELGVDRAELTRRRYAHWRRMLTSGWSLDAVAHVYGVKPNSVKLGLWNAERFSLVEAKKKAIAPADVMSHVRAKLKALLLMS